VTEIPETEMNEAGEPDQKNWWDSSSQQWAAFLRNREEQVFLVLTLLIGALVGLVVVAFILVTERFGARLYPAGGAAWRRLLVPVAGSLGMGYLLYRFFPDARGSGVPQTKAAVYARGGRISLRTESFSAPRQRWPADFRSDARDRRSRLGLELRPFWAEDWACGRTR
jgi:hypothetical protein